MVEPGELPLFRKLPALTKPGRASKDPSNTPLPWTSSPLLRASNSMNSPLQRLHGNEWKEYCKDFYPSAGPHSGSFKKKADVDINKEAFFELDSLHDEECSSVQQESIIEHFDISGEQRDWEYVTRGAASSNTSNATESHEEGGSEEGLRNDDESYPFFISRSNTGGRRCLPPRLSTGMTRYSERSLKREGSYKYSFSPSPDDDHYQKSSHEAELMYYQCNPSAIGREVSAKTTESRPLACSYATKRVPKGSSKYSLMSAQRHSPASIEDELMKSELDSSELIENITEKTYRVSTGIQWKPHSAKGLNTSRRKGLSVQHPLRFQKVSSPNSLSSMNSTVLQKGPLAEPFRSAEIQDDRESDVSVGSLVGRNVQHRLARNGSCEDRHCKEPSPATKSEQLQLAVSESKDLVLSEDRPRSLSQKYRPRVFAEIVGQHLVAQSLTSAILKDKIAPVYLFQGPQGTGKTSAARIFAAALLCSAPQEQRPCGNCNECTLVTSRRNSHVKEVDATSHNGIVKVKVLLEEIILASASPHYKVFIIDECHVLTTETWNALLKILEEPPINVVFILITTDPDQLPRTAVSRCQKFPFPKIKDAEIIKRLTKLASHECLNLDLEVLKLIASRSDGSLRDAENILDQLSLLGQEIDSCTVHELVGSASEGRMLSLLDSALLADTVNTIKRARELVDSGVQPLSLMSQMATLIIDILAGKYEFTEEQRKGFFRRQTLSEDKLERLRKAVKTLSEAEKQLRVSNDKMTWLTAALLQLGPDQSCMFPGSHAGTSVTQSPITLVDTEHGPADIYHISPTQSRYRGDVESPSISQHSRTSTKGGPLADEQVKAVSSDTTRYSNVQAEPVKDREHLRPNAASSNLSLDKTTEEHQLSPRQLDDIWVRVVQNCRPFRLRQSLYAHGKLVSISLLEVGAVVCLEFFHSKHKTRCESSWQNIANAFEAQLGCPVEVKISLVSEHGGEPGSTIWKFSEQGVSEDFVTHYGISMQPGGGLVNTLRRNDTENSPVVSQAPSESTPKEIGCLRARSSEGNTSSSLQVCPGASKHDGPNWRMSDVMSSMGTKEWPRKANLISSEEQLDKAWICDAERFSPPLDSVKMVDGEIIDQSESCEHTAVLPTKAHFTQEPQYQNPHGWSCEDIREIVELDILSHDSHTFGLHIGVEDESRRVLDGLEGCTEPGSACSQKRKGNTLKVVHRLALRNRNRSLPGNDHNTTHEERYSPPTCSATSLHRNSQSSNDTRFSGDISEHSVKAAGSRALLAPQLKNKLKGAAGNVARFLQAKLSRNSQDTFGQCI